MVRLPDRYADAAGRPGAPGGELQGELRAEGIEASVGSFGDAAYLRLSHAVYNTFGQITGMAAPWLLGALTAYPDGRSREQHLADGTPITPEWVATLEREWRLAFAIGAAATVLGCVAYFGLASDRVQPWALPA